VSITDEVANPEPEGESDPLERVVSRAPTEKNVPAGVFGYSAGKSVIASRLVTLFPAHKTYVEPFCGSAALYFTKEAAPTEVLNDRDPDVMHTYRTIRTATKADLAKLAAHDWVGSASTFKTLQSSAPEDAIDRLYKFLYLKHFTYGKHAKGSFRSDGEGRTCKSIERVQRFQPRLKRTKLLCGDYAKAIQDHDGPDAFHFLDPPYAGTASWGSVGEGDFDEEKFRKVLDGIRGKFLLTYGTTGKLDTSGFEVKRMRQVRNVAHAVGGKKSLTHLIVSNFKVTAKSLGAGFEMDDVISIIDTEGQGRIMPTGSQTSVTVPMQLRSWQNKNDLLEYPAEAGAVPGALKLRFLDKRVELDFFVPVNDGGVGWTFDVQRADVVQPPEMVAKGFSMEGSRTFHALSKGVPAHETPLQSVASAVAILDEPHVELGLQTDAHHEYFLTKSGECAGQLVLGRGGEGASALFDEHPWIATYIDNKFIPTAMLKGAPMPPDGVSALPIVVEKVIPVEFRYWELRGEEARKCRDALRKSGFFDRASVAVVDGELAVVTASHALLAPAVSVEPVSSWPLHKTASLLKEGETLVEVFSPSTDALAKSGDRVAYVDAGDVTDGALEALAKALETHPGEYVVTAVDTAAARSILSTVGRPFQFRPGDGVSVDAVKRIFVASFGVRGEDILWCDKNDHLDGAPNLGDPDDPHNPKLRETNVPSDDVGDLGKFLSSLFKSEPSPRKMLETIGPPNEWSGGVASALGPARIKAMNEAWNALSPSEKKTVEGKFHENFTKFVKAEFNNPDPGGAGEPAPRERDSDFGKADFVTGAPGTLQPAVQFDVAGSPKVRERDHERELKIAKASANDDEHYVLGIVLEPDVVDAQQDIYSANEVRDAAHKYMAEFQNRGLMHKEIVNGKVDLLESYLAPADFTIGDQHVKKGTWVMAVRVKDAKLWGECKSGGLTGFSIGGSANRKPDPKADAKHAARKDGAAEKSIAFQGIPITVDRPKGTIQTGTDAKGKAWSREYKTDYGFIPSTKGGDGEGLDVFVGPNGNSPFAYWATQLDDKGDFDEYKLFLGYDSQDEAKKAYTDHIPAKYLGGMREGSVHQIKALLNQEPKELAKAFRSMLAVGSKVLD
jgi:site-specific DNA-adenine methylase